jgi:DNA-binding NtrC family response regulator
MTVDQAERKLIELTLAHTRDNKTRAAEILGVTVKTLYNKLRRFRLEAEEKP